MQNDVEIVLIPAQKKLWNVYKITKWGSFEYFPGNKYMIQERILLE